MTVLYRAPLDTPNTLPAAKQAAIQAYCAAWRLVYPYRSPHGPH